MTTDNSWALVVGIDEYDDPKLGRLRGAARDAAAAVGWLRRIGLREEHILLHATPCDASKPELDQLNLNRRGGRLADIVESASTLMTSSGERLFVFLFGHGIYEPTGGRLFLTQDWGAPLWSNMGVNWYINLFLSLPYPRQFLVLDGCQNYPYDPSVRQAVAPGGLPGVPPPVARPGTSLTGCFGASQNQLVMENQERGLFSTAFFETLDPDHPYGPAIDVDDSTGVQRVDLRLAMDVVTSRVTDQARASNVEQIPMLAPYGEYADSLRIPIFDLVPERTARLQVLVDPATAADEVKAITLWSAETAWRRDVPVPPGTDLALPIIATLPVTTVVSGQCRLKSDSSTQYRDVKVDDDRSMVFKLSGPTDHGLVVSGGGESREARSSASPETDPTISTDPTIGMATIVAVNQSGAAVTGLTHEIQSRLAKLARRYDGQLNINRLDDGISVAGPDHLLAPAVEDLASAVDEGTPSAVDVFTTGSTQPTMVAFTLKEPYALAGPLVELPTMSVGDHVVALQDASRAYEVAPGPVTVRIKLPWGTWMTNLIAEPDRTVQVDLPTTIGVPPLRIGARVRFAESELRQSMGICNLAPWTVKNVDLFSTAAESDAPRGDRSWLTPTSRPIVVPVPDDYPRDWRAVATVGKGDTRVTFPLHPLTALVVAVENRPRVEPYSNVPDPAWDILVGAGRLDEVATEVVEALCHDPETDVTLRLAAAYAAYVRESDEAVMAALSKLHSSGAAPADVAVLATAVDRRRGQPDDRHCGWFESVSESGVVPVLRWGISLGVPAAQSAQLSEVARRWQDLEHRLLPTSVWTCWR